MQSKTLLITGGTGSFGHGFCGMILRKGGVISHVRIYSRNEKGQNELRQKMGTDLFSYFIGDIRDQRRLARVMDGVDYVIHAAALKIAPIGEIEAQEFVKTNVVGSMNVVEAALSAGVSKCLLISTDKAVEPLNLYGATKMVSEKIFLQANAQRGLKKTLFSCTRYGNVCGTSGSVVELFKYLPVDAPTPITNSQSTRFWITLDEANSFIYNSLLKMKGGEVFVPDWIKSVRITDVAQALRPNRQIKYIGLRPGDKIHEVLRLEPRLSSDKNEFMSVEEIRRSCGLDD